MNSSKRFSYLTHRQNNALFSTDDNLLDSTIPSEIMQLKELSELVLGKYTNQTSFFRLNTNLISALLLDYNLLKGPIPDFHPHNKLKIVSLGKDLD